MRVKFVYEKISAGCEKGVCSARRWLPTTWALQIEHDSKESKKTRHEKENLPLFISVESATYKDGSSILYDVMLIRALRILYWCFGQCRIIPRRRFHQDSLHSILGVLVVSMAQPLAREELQFQCCLFVRVSLFLLIVYLLLLIYWNYSLYNKSMKLKSQAIIASNLQTYFTQ